MYFKKKLKKIINFFGYDLINLKLRKQHTTFEIIFFLLNKVLKNKKKCTIFDVGASIGEFSKEIELYLINNIKNSQNPDKGEYEFHMFEPNLDLHNEINKKKISKGKIYSLGLGDKKEKKIFFKHEHHTKSSFLNVDKNYFKHKKKYQISNVELDIDTLDNFCRNNNIQYIDFLKIDAQGYNAKVIEGAQNLINNNKIGLIYSEITLGEKYESLESFYDFEKFLNKNYSLYGIDVGNYSVNVVSKRYNPELNLNIFYINKEFLI